jgi:hypothetical protein
MVAKRVNKPGRLRSGSSKIDETTHGRTEHRLENEPRFLRRIEKARRSLRAGRGVRLEDL